MTPEEFAEREYYAAKAYQYRVMKAIESHLNTAGKTLLEKLEKYLIENIHLAD